MKRIVGLLLLSVLLGCDSGEKRRAPRQTMGGMMLTIIRGPYGDEGKRELAIYYSNEKLINCAVLRTTLYYDHKRDSVAGYRLDSIKNIEAGMGGKAIISVNGIPSTAWYEEVAIDTVW